MADLSINSEQKYLLDGVQYNAPIDWQDITIEADYENDSIQPSLTIDSFSFTLEARDIINKWISDGLTGGVGIFEGMPFQLTLFNNLPIQETFEAYIDFRELEDLVEDGKIDLKIIKQDGLDNLFSQMESITFGYLKEIGEVVSSDYTDVDYVVEKKFNLIEILITSVILYLMIKELAESIERTADAIAEVTAWFSLIGLGVTGVFSGTVLAIAKALIAIVYTAVLIIAIIDLARTLLNTLVPPIRTHKAIKLKRALEIIANHFGYNFVTNIAELESVVYLPSNPNLDEKTLFGLISTTKGVQEGIPNTLDFGYNCAEMFDLAKSLFDAKISIVGNDLQFRPRNDPFWIQQSLWIMPSILIEKKQYNTEEMSAERLLSFEVDLNDDWTIDNYEGTSYEIRTSALLTIRKDAVLLKGLDEVNFKTCLGNRKDELNGIEKLLKTVAAFIDGVTGAFGGGTNFAGQINAKVGVLKQTSNWHSIPKLIWLDNSGRLPVNHRVLWRAKNLYFNYHKEKSFVLDNYRGQKTVYNDVQIPFGFEDYKKLTTNPYFFFRGNQAKIIKFVWTVGQDTATVSFWVREVYTKNLKEVYIEAS